MSFEEKLINIVKDNEIIYNKSSKGYKNIKHKFETWKKIGEELGESDETCRLRWKSLRDKFSRELKLTQESSGSGNKFRQEWEFFDNMRFLTDFIKSRNSVSNFSEYQDDGTRTTEADTEVSINAEEWESASQSNNPRKRKRSENEDDEIENTIKSTLTTINNMLVKEQRNIPIPESPDDESFKRLRSLFDGLKPPTKKQAVMDMTKYLCELQIQDIQNIANGTYI